MYSTSIRIKQQVFGLYKSFRVDEKNKPKNAIHHWLVIVAVFFVLAVVLFKGALAGVAEKGKSKQPPVRSKVVSPPLPGNAPVLPPPPVAVIPPAPPVPVAQPITTLPTVAINSQDLPRVIGLVDVGRDTHYLLSTGQIVACKRQLNIGDIYIK